MSGVKNMATIADTRIDQQEQTLIRPSHQYHAEAHVLSGELKRPIEQKIEQHAPVSLKSLRGGHLTRFTEDVSIEGLISFKTGHTRVSGSRSLKHHGWVTLSTSIMEGLNVFEVITADRVVAQVSTEHLNEPGRKPGHEPDHVPRVTFVGTQFKNLRVSGIPVKLTLDLGICGEKPEGDSPYVTDHKFLSAVQEQVENIAKSSDLPKAFKDKYDGRLADIKTLRNGNRAGRGSNGPVKVKCSLVKSIHIEDIEQIPGLKTVGNVLIIPEFGIVALAEVEVGTEPFDAAYEPRGREHDAGGLPYNGGPAMSNYFHLTMLEMDLGCIGHGTASAVNVAANGHTRP
jgi:hypothetical protein